MTDYTRVIDGLPNAPMEQVAAALVNRGVAWGRKGDIEQQLADYTRVIALLPGAPVGQIAQALVHRGLVHSGEGFVEMR